MTSITFNAGRIGMDFSKTKVLAVHPDTQAAAAGVQPGWFIKSIGGQAAVHDTKANTARFRDLIGAGQDFEVTFSIPFERDLSGDGLPEMVSRMAPFHRQDTKAITQALSDSIILDCAAGRGNDHKTLQKFIHISKTTATEMKTRVFNHGCNMLIMQFLIDFDLNTNINIGKWDGTLATNRKSSTAVFYQINDVPCGPYGNLAMDHATVAELQAANLPISMHKISSGEMVRKVLSGILARFFQAQKGRIDRVLIPIAVGQGGGAHEILVCVQVLPNGNVEGTIINPMGANSYQEFTEAMEAAIKDVWSNASVYHNETVQQNDGFTCGYRGYNNLNLLSNSGQIENIQAFVKSNSLPVRSINEVGDIFLGWQERANAVLSQLPK